MGVTGEIFAGLYALLVDHIQLVLNELSHLRLPTGSIGRQPLCSRPHEMARFAYHDGVPAPYADAEWRPKLDNPAE